MITSDVLRSLRYLLHISDQKMLEILHVTAPAVTGEELVTYLKKEEEPGYVPAPEEVLAHFLNALILHKRGRDPERQLPPLELPLTNNLILKKLRVAFELKDEDIVAVLAGVGFSMSKSELGALFRRADHKNYRPCGDQLLRNFLKGLVKKYQ